jgi:hypothetical protein
MGDNENRDRSSTQNNTASAQQDSQMPVQPMQEGGDFQLSDVAFESLNIAQKTKDALKEAGFTR